MIAKTVVRHAAARVQVLPLAAAAAFWSRVVFFQSLRRGGGPGHRRGNRNIIL